MRRRRAAADEKDPDVITDGAAAVDVAPAQIVQRVFHRLAHRLMNAIGHQSVQPGAFIHFVEMRQRLAFVQHAAAVAAVDRRAIGIVQRSLDQVGCRQQILQSLLVLDADRVAAEIVGDPQGRDVHLALLVDLVVGQIGFFIGPVWKVMPRSVIQLRTPAASSSETCVVS